MTKRVIKGRDTEVVFKSNQEDNQGTQLIKHNFNSVVNPSSGDDSTLGYSQGSVWINVSTNKIYTCTSNTTSSAVWVLQASGELVQENHLGSTNASLDNSVSGRGIFLRRPDGTLREVCLDDNDNIVIYSV